MKSRVVLTGMPSGAVQVTAVLAPGGQRAGGEYRRGWVSDRPAPARELPATVGVLNPSPSATMTEALWLGLRLLGHDVERRSLGPAIVSEETISRAREALAEKTRP